jgi:hypothetical protein
MKIRNGFVINSSSSSFIVIFPREPKDAEDVKNILFEEGQETYLNPYPNYAKQKEWSIEQVSNTVWKDIQDQNKNNLKEAIDEISSGYLNGSPKWSDFDYIDDWNKRCSLEVLENKRFANRKIKEFFNVNKDNITNEDIQNITFYIFSYSDESGEYFSSLEHGNLFDKLKHIKISHH